MRNTFGKLCVIIATIVLLFSAGFFTVSLILRDSDAIEQKYKELDVTSHTINLVNTYISLHFWCDKDI